MSHTLAERLHLVQEFRAREFGSSGVSPTEDLGQLVPTLAEIPGPAVIHCLGRFEVE
jgi:hypothetical protein